MAELSENEVKSQEVPLTGTAREMAVAKALYDLNPIYLYASDSLIPFEELDDDDLQDQSEAARVAIDAHLLALEQMELPEEVSRAGRETLLTHGRTLDDAFRAICAALRSPKTASEASR